MITTLLETDRLIVRRIEGLIEFKAKCPAVTSYGRISDVWRIVTLTRDQFDQVVKTYEEQP